MREFEEIALSGAVIRFIPEQGGIRLRFEHCRPEDVAMYLICASHTGEPLCEVEITGMGAPLGPYPKPSVLVCMVSDREGMFGRLCPRCARYFRTACAGETHCPYCEHKDSSVAFATPNQRTFIREYCRAFLEASRGKEEVEIRLDPLIERLPGNKPAWVYCEERQQTRFTCIRCHTASDIIGLYGACPHCGHRNNADLFSRRMERLQARFDKACTNLRDRDERQAEWAATTIAAVAEFEALGNDLRDSLARLPATPRRRKELSRLSFQSILEVAKKLEMWYGIDILEGLNKQDKTFINRMFNVRHVLMHRGGQVDEKYLENTQDSSVKLGQTIRVRSRQVRRLLQLVKECGMSLARGYDSLFED